MICSYSCFFSYCFSTPQLEPLGVDTELDKTKLVQSKKAGERKAVKKAYEEVGAPALTTTPCPALNPKCYA